MLNIVVANRLPVHIKSEPYAKECLIGRRSPGGLVTAISQLHPHKWIGTVGSVFPDDKDKRVHEILQEESQKENCQLILAKVGTQSDYNTFYNKVSNGGLWPLFHGMEEYDESTMEDKPWKIYQKVNKNFARSVAENIATEDKNCRIWIHDYQMIFVGKFLKNMKINQGTGFFLHIPFPSPETFNNYGEVTKSRAVEIIQALLKYDNIGFHVASRDLENFMNGVKEFIPDAVVLKSKEGSGVVIAHKGHLCTADAYPISIDYEFFNKMSNSDVIKEKARELRNFFKGRKIIFSAGRMDYTKGFYEQLQAYEILLEKNHRMHKEVVFNLVTLPSRDDLPAYRAYTQKVEGIISDINKKYGSTDWTPVHHNKNGVPQNELPALYRVSDVIVITPTPSDGMNLVIKEAIACSRDAAFILSPGAGTTVQFVEHGLEDKLSIIDPKRCELGISYLARAMKIHLEQPAHTKRAWSDSLRKSVSENDIKKWANSIDNGWNKFGG